MGEKKKEIDAVFKALRARVIWERTHVFVFFCDLGGSIQSGFKIFKKTGNHREVVCLQPQR